MRRLPLGVSRSTQSLARDHHLADDLAGGEVAHQPLGAGVAERAVQRAADLGRHAQRAAVGLGNVDALDLVGPARALAGQPQQPLAGAVAGDLLGDDLGARQGEMAVELGAHLLRHVRHLVEALGAADIEPVPQLLGAHPPLLGSNADAAEQFHQLVARQPDQRRLGRRHIGFERGLFEQDAPTRTLVAGHGLRGSFGHEMTVPSG